MKRSRPSTFILCITISLYWFWVHNTANTNLVVLAILYLNNKTIFRTSIQRNWFAHFLQLFIICYWKNQFEIYQDQMESGLFCTWTKPFFNTRRKTPGRFLFSLAELATALRAQLGSRRSDCKKDVKPLIAVWCHVRHTPEICMCKRCHMSI